MKVYEAIADALLAEGCDNLFGLMGDGNMWLWSSLAKKQAKIISARHEAAAVSMADGYSRTTGKVGVAMVTCGPGLTQLGTVLIIAARNRSQLVVVTGEINPGAKNKTQSMDQKRFTEACSARFHTVTSIDNMAEEIAEAFYTARVHRVPVVLNLNMHLQEQIVRLGLRLSALDPVPAAARGKPQSRSAGAGDRETGGGATAGDHRRQGRDGFESQRRDHQTRRSGRRAAGDVVARQGVFRRPAMGYRHRRRLRVGAVGTVVGRCRLRSRVSARSLAITRPRADCCSRAPRSPVSISNRCRRRSASFPVCISRATRARPSRR